MEVRNLEGIECSVSVNMLRTLFPNSGWETFKNTNTNAVSTDSAL